MAEHTGELICVDVRDADVAVPVLPGVPGLVLLRGNDLRRHMLLELDKRRSMEPLSFLSGQSRYCGARFVVRRAGGKNNLKMPFTVYSLPSGPGAHSPS